MNEEEAELLPSKTKMSYLNLEGKMIDGRGTGHDVEYFKLYDGRHFGGFHSRKTKSGLGIFCMHFIILFVGIMIGWTGHKLMMETHRVHSADIGLSDLYIQSGIHFCMPFATNFENIQIRQA